MPIGVITCCHEPSLGFLMIMLSLTWLSPYFLVILCCGCFLLHFHVDFDVILTKNVAVDTLLALLLLAPFSCQFWCHSCQECGCWYSLLMLLLLTPFLIDFDVISRREDGCWPSVDAVMFWCLFLVIRSPRISGLNLTIAATFGVVWCWFLSHFSL